MSAVLYRNVRLLGEPSGRPLDALFEDDRLTAFGQHLATPADTRVVAGEGRSVSPGFWDEHVHFTQVVRDMARVDLLDAGSAAEALVLVQGHAAAHPDARVVQGRRFRDALWPDRPSLAALDAAVPDRPAVLVSMDLHCGWVNSRAATLLGVRPDELGLVREAQWMDGLARLDALAPPSTEDVIAAERLAVSHGVVGIVDMEKADNVSIWRERFRAGANLLRVEASIWPAWLDAAIAQGLHTGDPLDDSGRLTVGPLKIIVDGSLNTRSAFCWDRYPDSAAAEHPFGVLSVPEDELRHLLTKAKKAGITPAVHAIGDRANTIVLDAFEATGAVGRVEHAQLLRWEDIPRFAKLGLTVSVQPQHAMDDRDLADRVWAGRTDRAFAFKSLLDAGATLCFGSDAPVAPLDPWVAINAAVTRTTNGRSPWHPEQALPFDVAVNANTREKVSG